MIWIHSMSSQSNLQDITIEIVHQRIAAEIPCSWIVHIKYFLSVLEDVFYILNQVQYAIKLHLCTISGIGFTLLVNNKGTEEVIQNTCLRIFCVQIATRLLGRCSIEEWAFDLTAIVNRLIELAYFVSQQAGQVHECETVWHVAQNLLIEDWIVQLEDCQVYDPNRIADHSLLVIRKLLGPQK